MAEKLIEEGRDLGLTLDDMQDVLRTLYEGGN